MSNVLTAPVFTQRKAAVVGGGNASLENLQQVHNQGSSGYQAPAQSNVSNTGATTGANANSLTKFQFRQLFTLNERIAVDNAPSNTSLPAQARAAIVTLLKDLEVSGEVNLTLPQTIQGIQFLTSVGLLTPARAARILANQPPLTA